MTWTISDAAERATSLIDSRSAEGRASPRDTHERIAALWSAYLGTDVSAHDAAVLMLLMKVGRAAAAGEWDRDTADDCASYALIASALMDARARPRSILPQSAFKSAADVLAQREAAYDERLKPGD